MGTSEGITAQGKSHYVVRKLGSDTWLHSEAQPLKIFNILGLSSATQLDSYIKLHPQPLIANLLSGV
jgi:hypothetical protein